MSTSASNGLPRVWLLGDSIRGQYQPLVAQQLAGSADVVGPAENGAFSLYTLMRLDYWLAELGAPAIVHWNNGLHDALSSPFRRPIQMPLDDYLGNLSLILTKLRGAGAKAVIWATTTPLHPAMLKSPYEYWSVVSNAEIDRYNEAARRQMEQAGVPINDLHAVVAKDYDRYMAEDQLHLSPAGQEVCAKAVTESIRQNLQQIAPTQQ